MEKPVLSIAIPAYNEEKYIGACLDSVVKEAQRFGQEKVQIIVVNNASTDKTKEIASSYPTVQVIDEMRKGLVQARATGHANALADIIAHVDSDTIMPEGWMTHVVDAFQEDGVVAVSGPYVYYDLSAWQRFLILFYYAFAFLLNAFGQLLARKTSVIQGGNFATSRTGIEAIGGFNTNLSFYGEDADLSYRLARVGKVKFMRRLRTFSSARRLKKEGIIHMAAKYGVNYIWTVVFKKPFSKTSEDIRFEEGVSLDRAPKKLRE